MTDPADWNEVALEACDAMQGVAEDNGLAIDPTSEKYDPESNTLVMTFTFLVPKD